MRTKSSIEDLYGSTANRPGIFLSGASLTYIASLLTFIQTETVPYFPIPPLKPPVSVIPKCICMCNSEVHMKFPTNRDVMEMLPVAKCSSTLGDKANTD